MASNSRLSTSEKREIWRLRHQGYLMSQIAQEIGRAKQTVSRFVGSAGGIDPGMRKRSPRQLSLEEREEISVGISKGMSYRQIALQLNRSASTVSREVQRNSSGSGIYRALSADAEAYEQAKRPKLCKLATHPELKKLVACKLDKKWSPEQISMWLRVQYPGDQSMQISHETIYRSLYIQARGVLKEELKQSLRQRRPYRRCKKKNGVVKDGRGQIVNAISISERPAEIEDRALPGHWEGDLIAGTKNSYIATLVERQTRFTILVKVESKHTEQVVPALIEKMKGLPDILKGTLTWDRGVELQQHSKFTLATDIDVYFCDPRSPWQRGSNENTNGLLRQYFPKGTDLSGYSQADLDKVAKELNERPRKTLGGLTPAQKLHQVLH